MEVDVLPDSVERALYTKAMLIALALVTAVKGDAFGQVQEKPLNCLLRLSLLFCFPRRLFMLFPFPRNGLGGLNRRASATHNCSSCKRHRDRQSGGP